MNQLGEVLQGFSQDQAIVALFVVILALCSVAACGALILNAMGGKGRTALFLGLAVVAVVWLLVRS